MGTKTGIEWTDSSWNPVSGCTKLSPASPGCANCYAETVAERFDELLWDALWAAKAQQHELVDLAPADYGDPCANVGEGWESATAVALALMVADEATGPNPVMTGFDALAWAATSNGDSDSIACMAGAVIGAAHTDANYWADAGVTPRFEDRYAKEFAAAVSIKGRK